MRQRATFSGVSAAGLCVVLLSGCGITSAVTNKVTSVIEKPKREEETKYSMARLHERNSNVRQAEELLLELHEKYPKKPEYAHRLANVYARTDNFVEAEKFYVIAQKLNPNNVDIYTDRGYAALLEGDYVKAEKLLKEALDRKPNDTRAANNMGMVLAFQGQSDEALRYFRRSTSEAEALCNLAYVHVQRGEGDQAMRRYNQALSIDPNLKVAANGLTQLAEARQRMESAQQVAGRGKAAPLPERATAPSPAPRASREVVPVSAEEKNPSAPRTRPNRGPSVPVRPAVEETPELNFEVEDVEEADEAPGRASVKKIPELQREWEMPERAETASRPRPAATKPRAEARETSTAETASWKSETKKNIIRPVDFSAESGLGGFSDPDDEEDDRGDSADEPDPKRTDAPRKTGASKPWWQD